MGLIIPSAIIGTIAALCFFTAYRQHKEKGFVVNNVWIYASQKERENMDARLKSKAYRDSRNIFFIIGIVFLTIIPTILFGEATWLRCLDVLRAVLVVLMLTLAIAQYIIWERLNASIGAEKKSEMDIKK